MSQIDRKADRHTRGRIMFMMAVFCVLLTSAVIIRLAFLQIINQDFYQQKALSNQTRDITLYPTRGTIYDTNGKPLAISASTEMLILNPRQIAPKESSDLTKAERSLLGFAENQKYTLGETFGASMLVIVLSILLAYACLKLYDIPVRRWLTKKLIR